VDAFLGRKIVDRMTEHTIALRHPAGRQIAFKMLLDPEFVSDQYIIEYCNKQACYEPEVAWVMMRALRPGDKAVDVGACVGFFTLLASQLVGPTGEVVAVEPGLDNLPKLKANLALNLFPPEHGSGKPISNVAIVEQPLFARAELVKFYQNSDSSGGHALWDPALWEGNTKTRAALPHTVNWAATTLNRITPSPCRLIKLDTEGAEERILQGGNNVLIVQHPPFIVAEINQFGLNQMMCSPDSLRAYMLVHGYDTFVLYPDGAYPELVPPRKTIVCEHIWNVLFSSVSDVASIWR
jgi:FkbM family methyltransferase